MFTIHRLYVMSSPQLHHHCYVWLLSIDMRNVNEHKWASNKLCGQSQLKWHANVYVFHGYFHFVALEISCSHAVLLYEIFVVPVSSFFSEINTEWQDTHTHTQFSAPSNKCVFLYLFFSFNKFILKSLVNGNVKKMGQTKTQIRNLFNIKLGMTAFWLYTSCRFIVVMVVVIVYFPFMQQHLYLFE